MLAPRTRERLAAHWADRLGVDPAAFDRSGASVGAAPDEPGLQVLRRGEATVVGAPEQLVESVRDRAEALADRPPAALPEVVESVTTDTGVELVTCHGPTFFGYADRDSFTPAESQAATRLLGPDDEAVFESFRAAFPDDEWAQADPSFHPGETVGRFEDGDLAAVATLGEPPFPHVAVAVAPASRGNGYGRAVVSRATDHGLADGVVAQYRTSDAWPWSVDLAESLGYERWATGVLALLDE